MTQGSKRQSFSQVHGATTKLILEKSGGMTVINPRDLNWYGIPAGAPPGGITTVFLVLRVPSSDSRPAGSQSMRKTEPLHEYRWNSDPGSDTILGLHGQEASSSSLMELRFPRSCCKQEVPAKEVRGPEPCVGCNSP